MATSGKKTYDMLLKSLIARIEFNNCLAPIQEYGRHQKKGAGKRKKLKKQGEGEELVKYDDNFYDLDDEFIDDGDLEFNHEEMVSEYMYSQSVEPDNQDDFEEDEEEAADEVPEEGSDEEDVGDLEMHVRLQKILKSFKVLSGDEVDELVKERNLKRQQALDKKLAKEEQLHALNQNSLKIVHKTAALPSQPGEKLGKASKKRDREEAFGGKTDDEQVDDILQVVNQKILEGETLNTMKREIQGLADKVDRQDPNWNQKLSHTVAFKLSQYLGKPETEMFFMLQRTSLLEKKKKKKAEMTKVLDLIKTKIEIDFKAQNKRSADDFIDME